MRHADEALETKFPDKMEFAGCDRRGGGAGSVAYLSRQGWICAGWLAGGQGSAGVYIARGYVSYSTGVFDACVCAVRGDAQRGVTYSAGACTTREVFIMRGYL